jgi:hypothetical protein
VSFVYLPPPKTLMEKIRDLAGGATLQARSLTLRQWLDQIDALTRVPAWTILPAVPEVQ